MVDINIENVDSADIEDFGIWVAKHLGGVRIPRPGPNLAASAIMPQIADLLAEIPNRLALATELYAKICAIQARLKEQKSGLDKGEMRTVVETQLMFITAKIDILYRKIQTLQSLYEAASRMITVIESSSRLGPRQ